MRIYSNHAIFMNKGKFLLPMTSDSSAVPFPSQVPHEDFKIMRRYVRGLAGSAKATTLKRIEDLMSDESKQLFASKN